MASGAVIFTVFVVCHLSNDNEFDAREIEKNSLLAGLLKSGMFLVVIAMVLTLQVLTIEVLTGFAGTERQGMVL